MRKPPTTGPDAAATPAVAPHAANAVARSRPWNVVERIASVAGSISDAPMPSMIASPRIIMPTECETDASSDPTPKNAAPITNIARWPYTSPRRPPMISNVANVERVAGDDPLEARQRRVELAQDRRDRDVEHRVVEHDDERRDDDDRERDPAARVEMPARRREPLRTSSRSLRRRRLLESLQLREVERLARAAALASSGRRPSRMIAT